METQVQFDMTTVASLMSKRSTFSYLVGTQTLGYLALLKSLILKEKSGTYLEILKMARINLM